MPGSRLLQAVGCRRIEDAMNNQAKGAAAEARDLATAMVKVEAYFARA
jgi:hypothetical protein